MGASSALRKPMPTYKTNTYQSKPHKRRCTLVKLGLISTFFALLVACSPMQINMPAISDAAGQKLPGKIVWHDLVTDKPEQSQRFYEELFAWDFEASEIKVGQRLVPYTLIRNQGQLIGGMVDQRTLKAKVDISQWFSLMSVEDIDASLALIKKLGGKVWSEAVDVGERGKIAVVEDKQGAIFALIENRYADPSDNDLPKVGDFLWNEVWASDLQQSSEFYQSFTQLSQKGLEQKQDYVLLNSQQPRFGLMPNPITGLDPVWLSYVRVKDEAALKSALGKVESLGGKILVNAQKRDIGGWVALVQDPSGAGLALQTWNKNTQTAGAK